MSQAVQAYSAMLYGVGTVCLVSIVILVHAVFQMIRPQPNEPDYSTAGQVYRWMRVAAVISAVILLIFFAPGFVALAKMNPEEFLRDFQAYVGRGINP